MSLKSRSWLVVFKDYNEYLKFSKDTSLLEKSTKLIKYPLKPENVFSVLIYTFAARKKRHIKSWFESFDVKIHEAKSEIHKIKIFFSDDNMDLFTQEVEETEVNALIRSDWLVVFRNYDGYLKFRKDVRFLKKKAKVIKHPEKPEDFLSILIYTAKAVPKKIIKTWFKHVDVKIHGAKSEIHKIKHHFSDDNIDLFTSTEPQCKKKRKIERLKLENQVLKWQVKDYEERKDLNHELIVWQGHLHRLIQNDQFLFEKVQTLEQQNALLQHQHEQLREKFDKMLANSSTKVEE